MSSVALLNRLMSIHCRSLPSYLANAVPWVREGQGEAAEVLNAISHDHQRTSDRLGELVMDEGGRLDPGSYPMDFTGYHDLSLDYLVTRMIDLQQQEIESIQGVVDKAREGTSVRDIAEESLGAAKGHLVSLQELLASGS